MIPAPTQADNNQSTLHHAPPPSSRFPASWYPPENDVTSTDAPVIGKPYTAVQVWHLTQPENATKAVALEKQFRDGEGRTRNERLITKPDGNTLLGSDIGVNDPVSHCSFNWTEPPPSNMQPIARVQCNSRTVHYSTGGFGDVFKNSVSRDETEFRETVHLEFLPKRTQEGLLALGLRKTWPAHDQTPERAFEMWWSPELDAILEISGTGVPPNRLEQIDRHEPNPTLFYPPPNYRIEPCCQGR